MPAHAVAKLSGFTSFVCLHTLVGVNRVHPEREIAWWKNDAFCNVKRSVNQPLVRRTNFPTAECITELGTNHSTRRRASAEVLSQLHNFDSSNEPFLLVN